MDTTAIKVLIDKYQLVQVGDKLRTYSRGVDARTFAAEVSPHKTEIIQYLEAERQAAKVKANAERTTFDAIPGVVEIREARYKVAKWNAALSRMMETGSGRMDASIDQVTPQQLAALEAQYPLAVFALDAERWAHNSDNLQMLTIWKDTYEALCAGKDPAEVKADHDARMSKFTGNVLFD